METEAPDSSPITICSLILPPGLSFYLLGLALAGAAPTPGEHGSFLEGAVEEALQAPPWRQDLSSQKRPGGGDGGPDRRRPHRPLENTRQQGDGDGVCPTSSQTCSEKITERMPVDGYRPWPCSQLSKTYLMKAGW